MYIQEQEVSQAGFQTQILHYDEQEGETLQGCPSGDKILRQRNNGTSWRKGMRGKGKEEEERK